MRLGMILFFVIWRLFIPSNVILGLGLAIIFCSYFAFLYRSDIMKLVKMIKK